MPSVVRTLGTSLQTEPDLLDKVSFFYAVLKPNAFVLKQNLCYMSVTNVPDYAQGTATQYQSRVHLYNAYLYK